MHMITRLLFGSIWYPEAEYNLRVSDLSELGRLLLCAMDRVCHNLGFPKQMAAVKNDIVKFFTSSYEAFHNEIVYLKQFFYQQWFP